MDTHQSPSLRARSPSPTWKPPLSPCRRAIAIAALAGTMGPTAAVAGSFYIPQQSVNGVGRAFIGGTVLAPDASTIFANPAGMTKLPGAEAQVGANVLFVHLDFDDRGSTLSSIGTGNAAVHGAGVSPGNPYDPTLIPNLYVAAPLLKDDLWVGLGVTAPFGLATEYETDWFGRYDTIKTSLSTINVGPAVAYRLNEHVSIGVGLDVQYANAELTQALPDPVNPGGITVATDGRSKLKGTDWSVGFNAGALIEPLQGMRLGLHYRSPMSHTLKGRLEIQLPAGLGGGQQAIDARTEIKLPDIVSAGMSYAVNTHLTLVGEIQWFNWSRFKEVRAKLATDAPDVVRQEGYRDTVTVGVAADVTLDENWSFRGGFQFDQTPTRTAFRNTSIPDANRYWLGFGARYRVADSIDIDASYVRTIFERSEVDRTNTFFDGAAVARVKGHAQYRGDTLSLAVRVLF